jgi:hypothetical protein
VCASATVDATGATRPQWEPLLRGAATGRVLAPAAPGVSAAPAVSRAWQAVVGRVWPTLPPRPRSAALLTPSTDRDRPRTIVHRFPAVPQQASWRNRLITGSCASAGEASRRDERNGECYPEHQMFRAVYRQIARFFNWINGTGSGSSASQAIREAENHRRDIEDRSGSTGGGFD